MPGEHRTGLETFYKSVNISASLRMVKYFLVISKVGSLKLSLILTGVRTLGGF